jgi:formylglycine-generating enzyme required for sulfatase activity
MQGNVEEWCQDGYSEVYYQFSPDADPTGPASASDRVICGGGWSGDADYARSAQRHGYAPERRSIDLGFRLARGPD